MTASMTRSLVHVVHDAAIPLTGAPQDFDPLLALIGDARFVVMSHYFNARLPLQFDAILHYDATRAVEPLERSGLWERGELPETYPSAL